MNLNEIEKAARQLFNGNSSIVKNEQLNESTRLAMQKWNTTSQVQQGKAATTVASLDSVVGWL